MLNRKQQKREKTNAANQGKAENVAIGFLLCVCLCVPKGNYDNVLDSERPDSSTQNQSSEFKLCIQDRIIIEW